MSARHSDAVTSVLDNAERHARNTRFTVLGAAVVAGLLLLLAALIIDRNGAAHVRILLGAVLVCSFLGLGLLALGAHVTTAFRKTGATMHAAGGHVAALHDLARWVTVQRDCGVIDGHRVGHRVVGGRAARMISSAAIRGRARWPTSRARMCPRGTVLLSSTSEGTTFTEPAGCSMAPPAWWMRTRAVGSGAATTTR